ncbi:MAG: dienelactone hydrolase family protein [Spirochaetales bacterium]
MERDITVDLPDVKLPGLLIEPASCKGLVIFVHGAGSNHDSPRNRAVAESLSDAGYVCVMFDLLTADEYESEDKRLDMSLMADRLVEATAWVHDSDFGKDRSIGYFGSSTGSAVAFKALNAGESSIDAVVSRGGRPDLVLSDLRKVSVPSLLVVGGEDYKVRLFNERAIEQLKGPRELRVVPEAGHLFEEPGAMEQVSSHAREWFDRYLARQQGA